MSNSEKPQQSTRRSERWIEFIEGLVELVLCGRNEASDNDSRCLKELRSSRRNHDDDDARSNHSGSEDSSSDDSLFSYLFWEQALSIGSWNEESHHVFGYAAISSLSPEYRRISFRVVLNANGWWWLRCYGRRWTLAYGSGLSRLV